MTASDVAFGKKFSKEKMTTKSNEGRIKKMYEEMDIDTTYKYKNVSIEVVY